MGRKHIRGSPQAGWETNQGSPPGEHRVETVQGDVQRRGSVTEETKGVCNYNGGHTSKKRASQLAHAKNSGYEQQTEGSVRTNANSRC